MPFKDSLEAILGLLIGSYYCRVEYFPHSTEVIHDNSNRVKGGKEVIIKTPLAQQEKIHLAYRWIFNSNPVNTIYLKSDTNETATSESSTTESTTMESTTSESATMESTASESTAMESTAMESTTVVSELARIL